MVDHNSYFIVIIICLQTIYNCILSVVGQYIYGYYLETYPDILPQNGTNISFFTTYRFALNEEKCTDNTTNNSDNSAQFWAQERSAELIFRTTLWKAFPLIVITYLFGLHASLLNRRLILLFSLCGNIIHTIICQAIIYMHLAEYWWCIAAFIAGLSGAPNVLGIVINLIVTESTEDDERSSRFVRLGALATALSAVVTFSIGYYIQWRGFKDLFWLAIGLELLSILVVIFLLKPTNSPSSPSIDETTALLSPPVSIDENVEIKNSIMSECSHCFDICTIFSFEHSSRKKSITLILIISSYVSHSLAISAMAPLLWYLLGTPFCWSSKDLGNFSAISLISTAIFSVLGMKILCYYGANDALICALGHICFFGYSLWIALAKYSWQLFLALSINPFSGYQSVLTVSMISKWLEVHERTHVFTLLIEINTIILAFGSSFANWVYARTVTHQKNFTLLFASGLCVLPFILNLCIFIISRKVFNEEELIPVSEFDVEPTTFSLSNNLPPQAADVACQVLPSRSRADSIGIYSSDSSPAGSRSSIDFHNDRFRAYFRRSIDIQNGRFRSHSRRSVDIPSDIFRNSRRSVDIPNDRFHLNLPPSIDIENDQQIIT